LPCGATSVDSKIRGSISSARLGASFFQRMLQREDSQGLLNGRQDEYVANTRVITSELPTTRELAIQNHADPCQLAFCIPPRRVIRELLERGEPPPRPQTSVKLDWWKVRP